MRILIVEDNELIVKALTALLNYQNYAVEVATDGEAAWDLIQAFEYDLILLDVMIPKLDGINLCKKLRSHGCQVPIFFLTSQDSSNDKVRGLDAGADDYVVKPFDSRELVARIRALLRRVSPTSLPILEWGNLRLDPSRVEVHYGTQLIQLTPKEYALLELFMRYPQRVFSCDAIIEHIWSFSNAPTEEAVRTQIKGLRQKLKVCGASPNLIETIYGTGYRLRAVQTKPSDSIYPEMSNRQEQKTLSTRNRFQERINQHISVLESAARDAIGDGVLRQLGQLLQQSLRGEDVVSRWYGEEFVVGLYGMTRNHGLQRLLQVLETLHKQKFTATDKSEFQITVSVGVAQYPEDGLDIQTLYSFATAVLEQTRASRGLLKTPTTSA